MVILNKQQEEARLALETFRSEFVSKQEEVKQALEHHERILMGEYDARLATLLTNCLNLRVPKAQIGRAWGYKSPISADHLINRYLGSPAPIATTSSLEPLPQTSLPQKTESPEQSEKTEAYYIIGDAKQYDNRARETDFAFGYPGMPEGTVAIFALTTKAVIGLNTLENRPDDLPDRARELFAQYSPDNLPSEPYTPTT